MKLAARSLLPPAACASISLLIAGCQSTSSDPSQQATMAAEASVNPGINDSYLAPDLDVTQWIERFEQEGREVYANREKIVDLLQIQPGMDIADVGSGTGIFVPLFSMRTSSEGLVYAVDIVPDFLKLIEERRAQQKLDNVLTVLCTERSVELPEDSIDLAFACDVYHHFEYPRSSVDSIYRALRPGGRFVVVDFKRIPGESSDWILNHVRADQETVTQEVESTGFKLEKNHNVLKDNYILVFRK